MAERIQTSAAAAGTAGAAFRKILTFLAKAAANYVVNDTNFPGIGVFLPCPAIISMVPGAGGGAIQVSNDNGTTWFSLTTVAAATQIGQYVYLDTANTIRVSIVANPADVRFFIQ